MSVYALTAVAAVALAFAIVTSFTVVAVVAMCRARSAAVPNVLRELTALANVLLRRRRQ